MTANSVSRVISSDHPATPGESPASISFDVLIEGFQALEALKIEKILSLTHSRHKRYIPRDGYNQNTAIILVNADNEAARGKWATTTAQPIILMGSSPELAAGKRFLSKPIISTKLLNALDEATRLPTETQNRTQPGTPHRADTPIPLPISRHAVAGPVIEQAQAAPQACHGYKVLIVDDSQDMRTALDIELRQLPLDIQVDHAESGEDALTLLARDNTYDLIFLDVIMPGMDGYETCKAIRKDSRYQRKTPIIMLSAKTSPLDEVKGVISGCTTYLHKPIVHAQFQAMLRRVVSWLDTHKYATPPNPS